MEDHREHKRTSVFLILLVAAAIIVVLALLAAAFLYPAFNKEIGESYQHLASLQRQIVQTDCGQIEVALRGEGEPVLISHGISGGFDQGLGLAEAHLSAGMQAIAPSRFGYLGTGLPENATPADQADAYVCLLDALEIDQVTLLANSAGGPSAIQMALRHPERVKAMILVSSAAPSTAAEMISLPPQPVIETVFGSDFLLWVLTTKFQSMMYSTVGVPKDYPLTAEDEVLVNGLIRSILPIKPRQAGFVYDMFTSNLDMDQHPENYPLEQIQVPTLIIAAIDDPLVKYENSSAMAESIPGSRLLTVESGGHLMLSSGDLVPREIRQFLEETIGFGD